MICATEGPCSVESPDIRSADQKDSRYPYMGPRRRPSLMPSELNTTLCRGHPVPARVVQTDTQPKTQSRIASPSGWAMAMAFWSAMSRIKAKPSSRREHFAFQPGPPLHDESNRERILASSHARTDFAILSAHLIAIPKIHAHHNEIYVRLLTPPCGPRISRLLSTRSMGRASFFQSQLRHEFCSILTQS